MMYANANSEPRGQLPRPVTIDIDNNDFMTCSVKVNVVNTFDRPVVTVSPANYDVSFIEDGDIVPMTYDITVGITDEDSAFLYQAVIYLTNTPSEYGATDSLYLPALVLDTFSVEGNGTGSITATGKSLSLGHDVFESLLSSISFSTNDQATNITRQLLFTVEEYPLGDTGPSNAASVLIRMQQLNDRPTLGEPLIVMDVHDDYLPVESNTGFPPSYILDDTVVYDIDAVFPSNPDVIGLAIVAVEAKVGLGVWQVWKNGVWSNISASECSPVFVAPLQRVRFVPDPSVSKMNGNASFRYRAWDGTSTEVCADGVPRIDQESPVSTDVRNFTYLVTYLNRPPVILAPTYQLPDMMEDQPYPNGVSIDTFIVNIVSDDDDSINELGLVVVGVDSSNGVWQYDDGFVNGWTNIPAAVGENNALHFTLQNTTLRFVPNPNFVGMSSIIVHGWDVSNSAFVTETAYKDITGQLSPSGAYTYNTTTLVITVTHVNDPPVVAIGNSEVTFVENSQPVRLFTDISITDSDSTTLTSAVILLTCPDCSETIDTSGKFDASGDSLTPESNDMIITKHAPLFITNYTDDGTTVSVYITPVSGEANFSSFASYLRSLYYSNMMEEPDLAPRTVTLQLSDGQDISNGATITVNIIQDNDNPPYFILPGFTAYFEESGYKLIISSDILYDIDVSLNLTNVTVTILRQSLEAIRILDVSDRIQVSQPDNGTVILSGPATIAEFNSAIRNIQYINVAEELQPGVDATINFEAFDGKFYAQPMIITVILQQVNDELPVITLNSTSVLYMEGSAGVYIASDIVVTDADIPSLPIESADVVIENPQDGDHEKLFISGDKLFSVNEYNNRLSISGGLLAMELQDMLRRVQYVNTAPEPDTTTRSISIVATDILFPDDSTFTQPVFISIDFVLVDDPPSVIFNRDVVLYAEGQITPVLVAPEAVITDVDNDFIAGLIVEFVSTIDDISHEVLSVNESLFAPNMSYTLHDDSVGFSITGVAHTDMYQAILRSLQYNNTEPVDPLPGMRQVIVTPISINNKAGVSDNIFIDLDLFNNAPILDLSGTAIPGNYFDVVFTEGHTTPVPLLNSSFVLMDVDDEVLTSITITLAPYLNVGQEALDVTVPSDVVADPVNASSIVLRGMPNASIESFQEALSTLTYINVADEPVNISRVVEFIVSDGKNDSVPVTTTITFTLVNDLPVLNLNDPDKNYTMTFTEEGDAIPIAGNVTVTDSDSDYFNALRVLFVYKFNGDMLTNINYGNNSNFYLVEFEPPLDRDSLAAYISGIEFFNPLSEPPLGNREYCISVSDGEVWSEPACVTIEFKPVNDNPPVFSMDQYLVSVKENITNYMLGLSLMVTDMDQANSDDILTWAIIDGDDCHATNSGLEPQPIFSDDDPEIIPNDIPCRFSINSDGRISTTMTPPDREVRDGYELVVEVSDGNFTDNATVAVTILDINDNPPCFNPQVYKAAVPPYAPAGYVVTTVTAYDIDPNAKITYDSFSLGGSPFSIDSTTGEISLIVAEDNMLFPPMETPYKLTIDARDDDIINFYHYASEFSCDATVTVTVPSNFYPPQFDQESYMGTVAEGAIPDTPVLTVNATDNDTSVHGVVKYDIVNSRPPFTIDEDTGDITVSGPIDYESVKNYSFTVRARNDGNNPMSSSVVVTIYVMNINDNAPMFTLNEASLIVCEDTPVGTAIFQNEALDDDAGEFGKVVYHLISDCHYCLAINASGYVYINDTVDYDQWQTISVVIFAADIGGLTDNMTFMVTVLNLNDNIPKFEYEELTIMIPETLPTFTPLHETNTAIDGDACSIDQCDEGIPLNDTQPCLEPATVEYSILSGNNAGKFDIDNSTGEIFLVEPLDYDSGDTLFVLGISATDGEFTGTSTVRIEVINISEFDPMFENSTYEVSVNEDEPTGSTILTVKAIDKDNSQLEYALSGSGSEMFYINPVTGAISINMTLDFETTTHYSFLVVANEVDADAGRSGFASVMIYVNDVNDNAPVFAQPFYDFSVKENGAIAQVLGTITATDADSGINGMVYYSIVGGSDAFYIDGISGTIITLQSLDHEAQALYNLMVAATDQGVPVSHNTSVPITISIGDLNDNGPSFDQEVYVVDVSEDTSLLDIVFNVAPNDPDDGINAENQYEIAENEFFGINQTSGNIFLIAEVDYESRRDYTVQVNATNIAPPYFSSMYTLNVTVTDANDNAPVFAGDLSTTVPEDAAADTVILVLAATDADEGSNAIIAFTSSSIYNTPFAINGTDIIVSGPLDRETVDRYDLLVTAYNPTDIYGPNMTDTVIVYVTDINDNPPMFSQEVYEVSVDEDYTPIDDDDLEISDSSGSGSLRYITTITTTDLDLPPNAATDYQIATNQSVFYIDSNGNVYATRLLDREEVDYYEIVIEAFDSLFSASTTLRVTVQDINDNQPMFSSSVYDAVVPENSPTGHIITTVAATDNDVLSNAALQYSIVDGGLQFGINSTTGVVYVVGVVDREIQNYYTFNVTVADSGLVPLIDSALIRVSVTDVNDNRPVINVIAINSTIPETTPIGTTPSGTTPVGTVVAIFEVTDLDLGVNAQSNLTLSGDADSFSINQNGVVTVSNELDYDVFSGLTQFNITLSAHNIISPHYTTTYDFLISITNENDNAPVIMLDTLDIEFSEGEYKVLLDVGITIVDADGREFTDIYDAKVEFIDVDPREPSYPFTPTTIDDPSECQLEDKVEKLYACGLAVANTQIVLPSDMLIFSPNFNIDNSMPVTTLIFNSALNQYVQHENVNFDVSATFTFLTWIWYVPTPDNSTIFSHVMSDGIISYGALCTDSHDLVFLYHSNSSQHSASFQGACSNLSSAWHHLGLAVHSLNGGPKIAIYIDGALYRSESIAQPVDTSGKLYLGGRPIEGSSSPPLQDYFTGRLHRMIISSSAVTDAIVNCFIGCGVYLYSTDLTPPVSYSYDYTNRHLYAEGIRNLEVYEEFLDTLVFVIAFEEPRSASYDLEYTVTDGVFNSIPVRLNIAINPSNNGDPILNLNGPLGLNYSATFTEDAGPVYITNMSSLTLVDVDLLPFPYEIVAVITDPLDSTDDEILSVSNLPPGMIESYADYTLSVSGIFGHDVFEAVLCLTAGWVRLFTGSFHFSSVRKCLMRYIKILMRGSWGYLLESCICSV